MVDSTILSKEERVDGLSMNCGWPLLDFSRANDGGQISETRDH